MATAATAATRPAIAADEHAPIEAQRAPQTDPLARADRVLAALLGGGFLAVAVPITVLLPSERSPSALVVFGLIVAYAAAFRLDFEVGAGFAIPTEVVLVPMLFILPLGVVPICVAGAILLARMIDGARRALHVERTLLGIGDAWHAVGPVAVLAAAGQTAPRLGHWPLYVAYENEDPDGFSRAYVTGSLDGGASWSAPIRVNDGPGDAEAMQANVRLRETGSGWHKIWEWIW